MSTLKVLKKKLDYNLISEANHDKKLVTFLNPYSYLFFKENINLFSKFDIIYIDGVLLVYLLKTIAPKTFRCSFDMTSLAPHVFKNSINHNKNIYFIGAKEIEISNFVLNIKSKYPNLNILGYRNGYFESREEFNETAKYISDLNPDIVIVGMGTPQQEKFLLKLRHFAWNGTGYTCGGFFHQTSQKIDYYPIIFDKLNLRWLYRIIDEPKLFKRYFFYYPKSILIYIFDLSKYLMSNKT